MFIYYGGITTASVTTLSLAYYWDGACAGLQKQPQQNALLEVVNSAAQIVMLFVEVVTALLLPRLLTRSTSLNTVGCHITRTAPCCVTKLLRTWITWIRQRMMTHDCCLDYGKLSGWRVAMDTSVSYGVETVAMTTAVRMHPETSCWAEVQQRYFCAPRAVTVCGWGRSSLRADSVHTACTLHGWLTKKKLSIVWQRAEAIV